MYLKDRKPDGTVVFRRLAYQAGAYTVSPEQLDGLRSINQVESYAEALTGREGMLRGYTQLEQFERDGHTWYRLQANGTETCIEVEVVDGDITQVVPLPPEVAWKIAVARDKVLRPEIIYDEPEKAPK